MESGGVRREDRSSTGNRGPSTDQATCLVRCGRGGAGRHLRHARGLGELFPAAGSGPRDRIYLAGPPERVPDETARVDLAAFTAALEAVN